VVQVVRTLTKEVETHHQQVHHKVTMVGKDIMVVQDFMEVEVEEVLMQ
jgi:hypothetical protein